MLRRWPGRGAEEHDVETGRWLGHENRGEVGSGVDEVRVGDLLDLPFDVTCGHWGH